MPARQQYDADNMFVHTTGNIQDDASKYVARHMTRNNSSTNWGLQLQQEPGHHRRPSSKAMPAHIGSPFPRMSTRHIPTILYSNLKPTAVLPWADTATDRSGDSYVHAETVLHRKPPTSTAKAKHATQRPLKQNSRPSHHQRRLIPMLRLSY